MAADDAAESATGFREAAIPGVLIRMTLYDIDAARRVAAAQLARLMPECDDAIGVAPPNLEPE